MSEPEERENRKTNKPENVAGVSLSSLLNMPEGSGGSVTATVGGDETVCSKDANPSSLEVG